MLANEQRQAGWKMADCPAERKVGRAGGIVCSSAIGNLWKCLCKDLIEPPVFCLDNGN